MNNEYFRDAAIGMIPFAVQREKETRGFNKSVKPKYTLKKYRLHEKLAYSECAQGEREREKILVKYPVV